MSTTKEIITFRSGVPVSRHKVIKLRKKMKNRYKNTGIVERSSRSNSNHRHRHENIIVRDNMIIKAQDFLKTSKGLEDILTELKRQRRINTREGEGEGGEEEEEEELESSSPPPPPKKQQRQAIIDRQWDTITIEHCRGRVDILLQEILKCHVEELVLDYSSGFFDESEDDDDDDDDDGSNDDEADVLSSIGKKVKVDSPIWAALYQALPMNTSLSVLRLRGMSFTNERMNLLSQQYNIDRRGRTTKAGTPPKNDNKDNNIKEISLHSPTFFGGSYVTFANLLTRHLAPSLRSIVLTGCKLSDAETAEFLSPILVGMIDDDDDDDTCDARPNSSVEALRLDYNMNMSSKTMAVIAQWLKGNNNIAGTEQTIFSSTDDSPAGQNSSAAVPPPPPPPPPHRALLSLSQPYSPLNAEPMHLGEEFLDALSRSHLEYFELHFYKISCDECSSLTHHLSNSTLLRHLQVLNLSNCNLSDHVSSIVSLLSSIGNAGKGRLVELNLSNCNLTDEGLLALSSQIHLMSRLETLNLVDNQTFSSGCISDVFIPALKRTINVKRLYIVVERIDVPPLRFICDINRGGRRYLLKRDHTENSSITRREYPASLWPFIFHRINYKISLPNTAMAPPDDLFYDSSDEDSDHEETKPSCRENRRASVIYYLLVSGAMIDCCSSMISSTTTRTRTTTNEVTVPNGTVQKDKEKVPALYRHDNTETGTKRKRC